MTEKINEVIASEAQNELVQGEVKEIVIRETENFIILKNVVTGKFIKKMKYHKVWTSVPETEEEQEKLFFIMNSDDDSGLVTPLKRLVGTEIQVKDFYTTPYESFNEETGENDNGVTTMIELVDGSFTATSSKSVYYTLLQVYATFVKDGKLVPFRAKVTSTKREKGDQINITFLSTIKPK